ncbi:UPF0553 protein [Thecamonas trahens ATCC 50062]|uniref:Queuosine 5'-phosphate N-glycosylase/hydrolase n=1 Tax=Thecamonas trahens ATCC 50062 TaxID=461836 RepID=A0A0L0DW01_THETB|nr:UPF0553 protein [Thecamonas trahens ATCC 50062]KNC56352.1 UPF0553 protein [Thecamonas trahens ATCC 50062]|eukprot:XP_013760869.1 UPF0553 protein [Thecamonas trahens ATCC 50062]
MAEETRSFDAGAQSVASVTASAQRVMAKAEHVAIADGPLAALADRLNEAYPADAGTAPYYKTKPDGPVLPMWEADEYHFRDLDAPELTAQYVLVLDALNFCFWPADEPGWEYDRLAGSIKTVAVESGMAGLSADALAALTEADLTQWFGGSPPPRCAQRVRLLNEVGRVLAAHFDGSAAKLIASAGGSAVELVARMVAFFPGFRDETTFDGDQVFFYKRAQIFVGDVWGAFGGEGLGAFRDIDQLTMFADYRIPQLLRHLGILVYSPELAALVDSLAVLPVGSVHEVEIRAATIVAVNQLRKLLHASWTTVQLDWWLWEEGEAHRESIGPHHRVLTTFY